MQFGVKQLHKTEVLEVLEGIFLIFMAQSHTVQLR